MTTNTVNVGIYDTWADWEAGYTLAHLGSGDWQPDGRRYKVVLVGETLDPITTKGGITLTPDIVVEELDPAKSDMLILPGADTWLDGQNIPFVAAAKRFLDAGVPVAAICGATIGMAAGGLLNDVDHTGNAPETLESPAYRGHDRYCFEPAVADGNVITASSVAPVEFAEAIFRQLDFYDERTNRNWYLLYGKKDPAGFFGLMEGANLG